MHNTDKLIPAKFLTLVAHLAITVTLIWSLKEDARDSRLPDTFQGHRSELILGLSLSLGLMLFELLAFLTGLTMFHSTSSLLSIGCHGSACFALSYLTFGGWHGAWLWAILFSTLPVVYDLIVITDVIVNKKY